MTTMTILVSCLLFLVAVRGEPASVDSDLFFGDPDTKECTRTSQCASRTITDYVDVSCRGYKSCESSTIRAEEHVDCGGESSCDNADITSNHAIFCKGNSACEAASNLEAPNIHCSGSYGCSEIESAGAIVTDSLYCTGDNGCYGCTISNVATITATGYEALRSATITATDGNSVTIYAYGYPVEEKSTGEYLTLACESGSSCVVYCSEDDMSWCNRMYNKCDSGAKCSVSYTSSSALQELINKQYEMDAARIEKRRKEINANRVDTVASNNKHLSQNHGPNDWLSQMVQKLQNMETSKIDFLLLVIGLSVLFFGIGFYLAYNLYKNYKTCENNEYQLIV